MCVLATWHPLIGVLFDDPECMYDSLSRPYYIGTGTRRYIQPCPRLSGTKWDKVGQGHGWFQHEAFQMLPPR